MSPKHRNINQYGLTDYQERFAHEYIANDFNASQAAKVCKPHLAKLSAGSEGYKQINNTLVRARIDMLLAEMMRKVDIDAEQVVSELAKGATANILDFFTWDDKGNVAVRPSGDIDRTSAAAIKSIRQVTRRIPQKQGDPVIESTMELSLVSKEKCLELLGKYFAMFIDRKEITSSKDLVERMQAAEKRLRDAEAKGGKIELVEDETNYKEIPAGQG